MAKKRKLRIDRLIILIMILMLITGLIFFALKETVSFLSSRKSEKQNAISDPEPVKTDEGVRISLDDYDVYVDDTGKLGFDFIIAKLHFVSDRSISFCRLPKRSI